MKRKHKRNFKSMKDKDKLILVLEVGIDKKLPRCAALIHFTKTYYWFKDKFDDSVIVIPIFSTEFEGTKISELNTKNFSTEEIDRIIDKANKLIVEFNSSKQ